VVRDGEGEALTAKRYEVLFGEKLHEKMEKTASLRGVPIEEFTRQALEFYIGHCKSIFQYRKAELEV
jgi:hypothetical protein